MNIDELIEEERALEDYVPRYKKPVYKSNAKSERAYWVDITSQFVNRPFKQILGLTSHWKTEWFGDFLSFAKSSKNPQATWWKILKDSRMKTVDK